MGTTLAVFNADGKFPSRSDAFIMSAITWLKIGLDFVAFLIVATFISEVALIFRSSIISKISVLLVGSRYIEFVLLET